MVIRLECSCGRNLTLHDDLVGKRIRCPECSGILLVSPPTAEPRVIQKTSQSQSKPPQSAQRKMQKPPRRRQAVDEQLAGADCYDPYAIPEPLGGTNSLRARRKPSQFQVQRILKMLFSWQSGLLILTVAAATGIWVYMPFIERVIELPVTMESMPSDGETVPEKLGQATSGSTATTRVSELCCVDFPNEPTPASISSSSLMISGPVKVNSCGPTPFGNMVITLSTEFSTVHGSLQTQSDEELLEKGISDAIATRAGSQLHSKRFSSDQDCLILDARFSFPAGGVKGMRYPAGEMSMRSILRKPFRCVVMVESTNPITNEAIAERDAIFESIRIFPASVSTANPGTTSTKTPNKPESEEVRARNLFKSMFPLDVNQPRFPELDKPYHQFASGETVHFVSLGDGPSIMGSATKMRVYLPAKINLAEKHPCILMAPAGTNMLRGNDVDAGDYHDEALPYAQAGMVVVLYSLDGATNGKIRTDQQLLISYNAFQIAAAGVTNGKIALEFALAKLNMVDPDRIYSGGHSSAATVSLLLASQETRLAGGIAYAPICIMERRLSRYLNDPIVAGALRTLPKFAEATSPLNYASIYQCPLFVFHARDDSNEPYVNTHEFVESLRMFGKDVEFVTAEQGNHYQSMIDEGIPAAIRWIKQQ